MNFFWRCLIALLVLLYAAIGCRATQVDDAGIGEWMSLTDNHAREDLLRDHGIPLKNDIFEGMMFWLVSPLPHEPPLAFHWSGERFVLWKPLRRETSKHAFDVVRCGDLEQRLGELMSALEPSVGTMMKLKESSGRIVVSPVFYELKYFPPQMLGSVTFSNTESDRVPWIDRAKEVIAVASQCVQGT